MPGAPDALEEGCDRARRPELADEVDLADVDAELERSGRHQRLELAVLEPLLGIEALLFGEAAVVRGHLIGADALGQLARHPLGESAGVDEEQRGAVRRNQLGQALIHLLPDLGRHHGLERRVREFEGEVAGTAVAGRPTRSSRSPQSAASRSSESARWVPRLFAASAWISSTITVRVVASIARPDSEPSRM